MLREDNNMVPIYYKIQKDLEKIILDSEIGTRLPTEDFLMKKYNVSRTPIRHALNNLERNGYIIKKAGKGTFVNQHRQLHYPGEFKGFRAEMAELDASTSTDYLGQKVIESDETLNKIFKTDGKKKILKMMKLRYIEEKPTGYEIGFYNIFSDERLFNLSKITYGDHNSIYRELQKMDISLISGEEKFKAVELPEEAIKYLSTKKTFGFERIRTMYLENGIIFENVRTYYCAENYEFKLSFRKI